MSNKIISYDLIASGKDYSELYRAIRRIDSKAVRVLNSVWWITSPLSVSEILNQLSSSVDHNDRLMVAAVSGDARGINLLS